MSDKRNEELGFIIEPIKENIEFIIFNKCIEFIESISIEKTNQGKH